jgi:hypothetical protein
MIHVLYHHHCADGFAAAFAAWLVLGDSARYVPVNYNEQVPSGIGADDEVYVLDFCYPRAVLEALHASTKRLVVLDHHATAEPEMRGLDYCRYEPNLSGCVLAWQCFHCFAPLPWLFHWIQQRDLGWCWHEAKKDQCELNIHELYAGLWLGTARTFQDWNFWLTFAERDLERTKVVLFDRGDAIATATNIMIHAKLPDTHWLCLDGHTVPAVNACWHQSELGNLLAERHSTAPFSVVWFALQDPTQIKLSLRARDGSAVDCGQLLRRVFGERGGGHAKTAGATITLAELQTLFVPNA